jgi:16S rRNA (adenine1518-N6/adenine1519-N6)-dimethyltransferase
MKFDIEYLFTVHEDVFDPPPKVKSAVIRLKRNTVKKLPCDEKLFKQIVKVSFNQRRKTMRKSLKQFLTDELKPMDLFNKRPEQLSVLEFIELTNLIESAQ